MTKISVAIITFNEEKNIERALLSVKDIADEIVIVDSFSTDKTEEICKNFNVTFIKNAFEGHIQQKNFALQQCTHEYLLSIDGDEALSEELKQSIAQLKQKEIPSHSFKFNRLNNYCGHWVKYGGWYPDTKVRLVKKGTAQWGGENPHDELIPQEKNKSIHLKGDLLHYTITSKEQHLKQVEYFTTIAAKEAYKKGKKSSFLFMYFAALFKFIKDYFLKRGFLDGSVGFAIARTSAFATYEKYRKLRLLCK